MSERVGDVETAANAAEYLVRCSKFGIRKATHIVKRNAEMSIQGRKT